jgi:hypothetical protein
LGECLCLNLELEFDADDDPFRVRVFSEGARLKLLMVEPYPYRRILAGGSPSATEATIDGTLAPSARRWQSGTLAERDISTWGK